MKLVFCGDIMPGGVLPYQDEYITPKLKNILSSTDYRVGTLECAIGDNLPYDETKMSLPHGKNIVYARECDFQKVLEININLVTLANNHIYDLGKEGLANTIRLLDENGIKHCGAGMNIEEASRPCIVNLDGKRFAFIGCCIEGLPPITIQRATEKTPGIYQTDEQGICDAITKTKKNADYVVVLPHWGVEYSYIPPQRCAELAKKMIIVGADAVIGSHTHIMNPKDSYKCKPIYYSLGNFLFPDFCLEVPRPITYPQTREEVYSLPIVKNYPKSIATPVRVVWGEASRRGVVALLSFDKKIEFKTIFTYLREDNVLSCLTGVNDLKERLRMAWYGGCYRSNLMPFINRVLNSRYNVFRKAGRF